MAMEYVRSVDESSAGYPQPFGNPGSIPMEGLRRQSLERPSSRGSIGNLYPEFSPGRVSFNQRIPEFDDNIDRSYRRQSLQLGPDRRASLAAEADNCMRRSSLPNPIPKDFKPQKKRVVGKGVYKLETLPWHESSLRQEMARRTQERKERLASPLPLINLRPEAETRLRDVLGEEGYAEWKRKHRASYLLNQS